MSNLFIWPVFWFIATGGESFSQPEALLDDPYTSVRITDRGIRYYV